MNVLVLSYNWLINASAINYSKCLFNVIDKFFEASFIMGSLMKARVKSLAPHQCYKEMALDEMLFKDLLCF